jgi:outer membrane protein TolC
MKSCAMLIVAGLVLFTSANVARAARYNLEALLARVRAVDPGLRASHESTAGARSQLGQAQLSWTPSGDFYFRTGGTPTVHNGDYETGLSRPSEEGLSTTYVDWLHPGTGRFLDRVQPFQGVFFTLSMSFIQPLLTFGKIGSAIGAAKAGVLAAKGYEAAARADLELAATRVYWIVKCQRAAGDVMDDVVARLGDWVARFQTEMEGVNQAGYTEADLARIKAALESARVMRFDIDRQLASGLAELRGLTQDGAAEVDSAGVTLHEDGARDLAWYQEMSRTRRPEMKLLEAGTQAARDFRRWRVADLLPSLVLVSGFGFAGATSLDNPLSNSVIGAPKPAIPYFALGPFVLHWDLDLAVRAARLAQARSAERAMRETERWAIGGIRVEVRKAYADHEEAYRRALQLAHAEKVARGWYNVVQDNMASGITVASDARELVDALRAYFDLRLRHLFAIMDSNLTLAALHRASGLE